ncbi:hypothetical protein LH704_23780 [Burkholderia cenocepacia]|nr:hypothetical protein [Burkholderia cenocepacia]MBR8306099.1 hypothetical protein [Burkholderia cenocepacia]MCF1368737.1 hypothetical protein [Burkholderia cenocepacia]MCF1387232.1 hypothetical protein [Burkholderia cenocepacia]MDR8075488.1 hypothetical protein [Burkholderia cenocepacia]
MEEMLILANEDGAQVWADTKTHVHQPGPLLREIHARVRFDGAVLLSASL